MCLLLGDVRNDLYVTIDRGEFEKGKFILLLVSWFTNF